jgi:hypothetical protein
MLPERLRAQACQHPNRRTIRRELLQVLDPLASRFGRDPHDLRVSQRSRVRFQSREPSKRPCRDVTRTFEPENSVRHDRISLRLAVIAAGDRSADISSNPSSITSVRTCFVTVRQSASVAPPILAYRTVRLVFGRREPGRVNSDGADGGGRDEVADIPLGAADCRFGILTREANLVDNGVVGAAAQMLLECGRSWRSRITRRTSGGMGSVLWPRLSTATSWAASMSSGMTAELILPVPPITRTLISSPSRSSC